MTGFKNLTYEMARSCGGLQIAKVLSRHHPKIFMYHRISNGEPGIGLSVTQFRQHIAIIKKEFKPMTLSALLSAKEQGTIPANSVVVTFDDGYADFAEIAFPILKEAEIPVTLFVTTGFVNRDIWLWPDQIRYAILKSEKSQMKFSELGQTFDIKCQPTQAWTAISNYCLTISNDMKLNLIRDIFKKLDVKFPLTIPEEYRPVTWARINEMIEQGLDIGSHSISHPVLTKLHCEQLFDELAASKDKIKQETGVSVDLFCYPNGTTDDFDARVKRSLEKIGYKYAVCAFPGKHPLNDIWCINRYPVGNNIDFFKKNIFGLSYLVMQR